MKDLCFPVDVLLTKTRLHFLGVSEELQWSGGRGFTYGGRHYLDSADAPSVGASCVPWLLLRAALGQLLDLCA